MKVALCFGSKTTQVYEGLKKNIDSFEFFKFGTLQEIVKVTKLKGTLYDRVVFYAKGSLTKGSEVDDIRALKEILASSSSYTQVSVVMLEDKSSLSGFLEEFNKEFSGPIYTAALIGKISVNSISELCRDSIPTLQARYYDIETKPESSIKGISGILSKVKGVKINNVEGVKEDSIKPKDEVEKVKEVISESIEDEFDNSDLILGSMAGTGSETGILTEEEMSEYSEYVDSSEEYEDNPAGGTSYEAYEYSEPIHEVSMSTPKRSSVYNRKKVLVISSCNLMLSTDKVIDMAMSYTNNDVLLVDADENTHGILTCIDRLAFYKNSSITYVEDGITVISSGEGQKVDLSMARRVADGFQGDILIHANPNNLKDVIRVFSEGEIIFIVESTEIGVQAYISHVLDRDKTPDEVVRYFEMGSVQLVGKNTELNEYLSDIQNNSVWSRIDWLGCLR